MAFTKNFASDPLGERVYLFVHGDPKVGKTHMVLDLIREHGDYVILFSLDKGTMAVRQEARRAKAAGRKSVFKGKLMIAYPNGLAQMRADMKEAETTVSTLYRAGVPRSRIWIVVDTATHLQSKLIAEARKINVKNPHSKDSRDEYVRDAVIEVDWNINLAHMSEVADFLVNAKANVVVCALSKKEKVKREETGRMVPALSGQSYSRFVGDADAVMRLTSDKDGRRRLELAMGDAMLGDRSGNLDTVEPPDLKHIQQKMIGDLPALPAGGEDEAANENEASALAAPAS